MQSGSQQACQNKPCANKIGPADKEQTVYLTVMRSYTF